MSVSAVAGRNLAGLEGEWLKLPEGCKARSVLAVTMWLGGGIRRAEVCAETLGVSIEPEAEVQLKQSLAVRAHPLPHPPSSAAVKAPG